MWGQDVYSPWHLAEVHPRASLINCADELLFCLTLGYDVLYLFLTQSGANWRPDRGCDLASLSRIDRPARRRR